MTAAEEHADRIGSLRTSRRNAAAPGATLPQRIRSTCRVNNFRTTPLSFLVYSPALVCRRPRETAACRRGAAYSCQHQTAKSAEQDWPPRQRSTNRADTLKYKSHFSLARFWYHITSLVFLAGLYYPFLQILARLVYMSHSSGTKFCSTPNHADRSSS